MDVTTDQTLKIADDGEIETLDCAGLLTFHQGDSWFGLSVGFRALQLAGQMFSKEHLWDRRDLNVASGHPGPGVRDAIEYVTRCVSRKRYCLTVPQDDVKCGKDMKFEWQVSDGHRTVELRLRPGFVPNAFFELLDRRNTEKKQHDDRQRFDDLKRELSERLWDEPLAKSFEVRVERAPVSNHA